MSAANLPNDRIDELLADQAVFGLSDQEQRELDELLREHPTRTTEDFELLAAELLKDQFPAPADIISESLRNRVRSEAIDFFAEQPDAEKSPVVSGPQRAHRGNTRELLAWLVTAAAIFSAVLLWRGGGASDSVTDSVAQRNRLVAKADDVLQVAWLPSKDPNATNATGDVVWSNTLQEGYLRFRDLKPNDPSVEQYQLWIIDGERDATQPVDGGVFDVLVGQEEVVIPIAAKLRVFNPKAFAITIEKPGGVVVSKRERLPLLASVEEE